MKDFVRQVTRPGAIVAALIAAALVVFVIGMSQQMASASPASGDGHPHGCSATVTPVEGTTQLAASVTGCDDPSLQWYVNVGNTDTSPQQRLTYSPVVSYDESQQVTTLAITPEAFGDKCTLNVQAEVRVGHGLVTGDRANHNRSERVSKAYLGPITLTTGTCAPSPSPTTSTTSPTTSPSPTSTTPSPTSTSPSPTTSQPTPTATATETTTATATVTQTPSPTTSTQTVVVTPTQQTPTGPVPPRVDTGEGRVPAQAAAAATDSSMLTLSRWATVAVLSGLPLAALGLWLSRRRSE